MTTESLIASPINAGAFTSLTLALWPSGVDTFSLVPRKRQFFAIQKLDAGALTIRSDPGDDWTLLIPCIGGSTFDSNADNFITLPGGEDETYIYMIDMRRLKGAPPFRNTVSLESGTPTSGTSIGAFYWRDTN